MHFRESTPGIIYPLNRKLGRGASPMQIAVSRTKGGKRDESFELKKKKNDKNQGNIFNHRSTRVVENQFTR